MKDREFLYLVYRLLHDYSYLPSAGVMLKLKAVAETIPEDQETPLRGKVHDTLPIP